MERSHPGRGCRETLGARLPEVRSRVRGGYVLPVRFNIAASYRKTWLNSYGAEWRTDAQLGYTKGLYTEFFQPVGLTVGAFVAPWAGVVASPVNYYSDGKYLGQYGVVKTRGGLDAGIQGKVGMIRLGFYQGYVSANSEFGVLRLPDFNVRQGGFMGRFAIDQLDDADFPREGIFIGGNYFGTDEAFGAQDSYNKYELALRKPLAFERSHPDPGAGICRQRGQRPASLRSVLDRGIPEPVGIQIQSARRPGIYPRRDRLHVPVRQPPLASGKRDLPGRIARNRPDPPPVRPESEQRVALRQQRLLCCRYEHWPLLCGIRDMQATGDQLLRHAGQALVSGK